MRIFIIAFAFIMLACQAQAGTDGINQLNSVMQNQSSDANDGATAGTGRPSGLGAQAQQPASNSPQPVKLPKAKLPNPNIAKVKQLDAQMKALKQKLESISGLPADQQQRIDQMHDHLMKMMALMNSLMEKISESQ
ncbi:MAG: hypothetical protein ACAH80_15850 [Alphaproteobacteria bacterium]